MRPVAEAVPFFSGDKDFAQPKSGIGWRPGLWGVKNQVYRGLPITGRSQVQMISNTRDLPITCATASNAGALPFDSIQLDRLLETARLDAVLVSSKHNIQYLLGGYRFFFFDQFDAIGITRYLPILIYRKGRLEEAVYIGNAMEDSEVDNGRFWCATVETRSWGTLDAVEVAIGHLRRLGLNESRIGVEWAFLPADAMQALQEGLPAARFPDGHLPLERLRAIKTTAELGLIREASDRVVGAMLATFAQCRPGMTKFDLNACLRQEEMARGLNFEYCLMTAGSGPNRAPSPQVIKSGDIVSLDSGGRFNGYIGDLCRMGIAGEPDAELEELLAWVESIQQAARAPLRAGVPGDLVFKAVEGLLSGSSLGRDTHFVAHGMGIIGHEAPRLSDRGPVTYPAHDAALPLQTGMVLSIETTLMHPGRGLIKLEDTLAVTDTGLDAYGDAGRGWNRCAGQA